MPRTPTTPPAAEGGAHKQRSGVPLHALSGPGAVEKPKRLSVATSAKTHATARSEPSELEKHLLMSIRAAGVPEPVREYRFHPTRKWRVDFCWPTHMLAVEVEGGLYRGGGHTSVAGLKRDIEKHRALTLMRWRLLRFHGDEVRSGLATEIIRQALAQTALVCSHAPETRTVERETMLAEDDCSSTDCSESKPGPNSRQCSRRRV